MEYEVNIIQKDFITWQCNSNISKLVERRAQYFPQKYFSIEINSSQN